MVKPINDLSLRPRSCARVRFGPTEYVLVGDEKAANWNPEAILVECDACGGHFSRSPKPDCSMIVRTTRLNWLCTSCYAAGAPREYSYDVDDDHLLASAAAKELTQGIQPCSTRPPHDGASNLSAIQQQTPSAISLPDKLTQPTRAESCLELMPVLKKLSHLLVASTDRHASAIQDLLRQLHALLQQKLSQAHVEQGVRHDLSSMKSLQAIVKDLTDGLKQIQGVHSLQVAERTPLKSLTNGQDPNPALAEYIRLLRKLCQNLLWEEVAECVQKDIVEAGCHTSCDPLSNSFPCHSARSPSRQVPDKQECESTQAPAVMITPPLTWRSNEQRAKVSPRYCIPSKCSEPQAIIRTKQDEFAGLKPAVRVEGGSTGALSPGRARPSNSPPPVNRGHFAWSQVSRLSSGSYTARSSFGRSSVQRTVGRPLITIRSGGVKTETPHMKDSWRSPGRICRQQSPHSPPPGKPDTRSPAGFHGMGSLRVAGSSHISLDNTI